MSDGNASSVTAWDAAPPEAAESGLQGPIPTSWLRLGALAVATLLIALTSQQGGLAAEDATVLLNGRAGLSDTPILFFYAGYASLLPDVISWGLRGLPLAAQAGGYMSAALAVGLLCGEEAYRLLRRFRPGPVALAGAVFLLWLTHSQSGLVFLNLTYLIWPALVWGALRLTRAAAEGRAPGWGATILLLLFGWSQPVAAAWTPAVLWLAWTTKGVDRWRMLGLLALIGLYDLANLRLAPHVTAGIVPFEQAWAQFVQEEGATGARNLVPQLMAVGEMVGAAVLAVQAARSGLTLCRRDTVLLHLLMFGALATLLYFASDRFLLYRSFVERYALPALIAGAAAGLVALTGRLSGRWTLVAVAALLILPAANLARGHLGRQIGQLQTRLAFLNDAATWRAGCGGGAAARALDPADRWSLVLPCARWSTPPASGFYTAAPDGRLAFSAEMSLDTAGVYVGQPLLGRRATP